MQWKKIMCALLFRVTVHIPTFLQQNLCDPTVKVSGCSHATAHSFIPIHRISFRSWEPIYFLISGQYLRERSKPVWSSVQQSICSLLAWMIQLVILCSSSMSLYIKPYSTACDSLCYHGLGLARLQGSGPSLNITNHKHAGWAERVSFMHAKSSSRTV